MQYNLYGYCSANPILYTDPSGHKLVISELSEQAENVSEINRKKIFNAITKISNLIFSYHKNETYDYTVTVAGRPQNQNKYPKSDDLISELISSKYTFTIYYTNQYTGSMPYNSSDASNSSKGSSGSIFFNPNATYYSLVKNEKGRCIKRKQPLYIVLAHELIHAYRYMKGVRFSEDQTAKWTYKNKNGKKVTVKTKKEELATVGLKYNKKYHPTENIIRKEHGLKICGTY